MPTSKLTKDQIIAEIRKSGVTKIKVAITDIDGVLRGKYIHINKFLSALDKGFGFCDVVLGWDSSDVCYDNVQATGWHTGYPDAPVELDLGTYRKIPWDNQTPFFLGDFAKEDPSRSVCPRQLLRKVIQQAQEMGFTAMCGLEFEFFNFKETPETLATKNFNGMTPLTPGMFGYSILRSSYNQAYFSALIDELALFDVPLEGLHTETGPGVFEAAILAADPLEAADRAVLFKTSVKEIAYKHEVIPSFMARWNTEYPGCSGHVHQSLWDAQGETNVFYDEKDPHKMSETFKHYLAGQLYCLPEILPFFAPTVNSYKRLVEGFWAPTSVTWGLDNRTAAFRVIPGSPGSTRLEGRVSGSDINPYLAVAAYLAAGLYGIRNKMPLTQEAVSGNAYAAKATPLPRNLLDATKNLADSHTARELFGAKFVEHFVNSRVWEMRQFSEAVTDWELKRYFEII